MIEIGIIFFLAFLFYLVIPGFGAFWVRAQWRRFRKQMQDSSFYPLTEYPSEENPISNSAEDDSEGCLGTFRFFGTIEAIQDTDAIWVRNGDTMYSVDMRNGTVYFLPSFSGMKEEGIVEYNKDMLSEEEPLKVSWKRIYSLSEGTKIFICGKLYRESGNLVFRNIPDKKLMLVIYDGDSSSLLRRAVWGGRQRNEYWNPFTPISLALGFFSLLSYAYTLIRIPEMYNIGLLSLVGSLIPLVPLFPPGVLIFFLYRNLWKKARRLRAERDILELPLRYFEKNVQKNTAVTLPNGEEYMIGRLLGENCFNNFDPDIKVRSSSLVNLTEKKPTDYFAFGAVDRKNGLITLVRPQDPMAEYVLIPGDPAHLSKKCAESARFYEWISAGSFAAGFLINLFVVLFLIQLFVQ